MERTESLGTRTVSLCAGAGRTDLTVSKLIRSYVFSHSDLHNPLERSSRAELARSNEFGDEWHIPAKLPSSNDPEPLTRGVSDHQTPPAFQQRALGFLAVYGFQDIEALQRQHCPDKAAVVIVVVCNQYCGGWFVTNGLHMDLVNWPRWAD